MYHVEKLRHTVGIALLGDFKCVVKLLYNDRKGIFTDPAHLRSKCAA